MGPRRRTASLSSLALALLCCIVITSAQSPRRFNITRILAGHPRFSVLNAMITSHGLADEINRRKSVTLLAPSNAVMRPFQTSNAGTDFVKITDLLRFHVILTFFDMKSLRALKSANYTQVTTLLQTTGRSKERDGFLNIYNLKSRNTVKVGPVNPDYSSNVTVIAGVTRSAFDVGIVEIDQVLLPVGFNNGTGDLLDVLDSFQEFTLLITYLQETNVSAIFAEKQASAEGITIFAPKDSAFNSLATGSIEALTLAEERLLLQYHALGEYKRLDSLETMLNIPTATLASTVTAGYKLNVSGNPTNSTVKLRTGVSTANILQVIYDAKPVTVYAVDQVLLPPELFTLPPPAPSPPPPPPKRTPKSPSTPAAADEDTSDSATLAGLSPVLLTLAALAAFVLLLPPLP